MIDNTKNFQVTINGENFLIETPEIIAKHGFYVNCFVEAKDAAEAELKAVEQLRKREMPKIHNDIDDPPKLYAKDIKQIGNHRNEQSQQGFVWYKS